MKLTQLEYFCVAARYHNITRASKELFVTQPSVSNAIKALEEEFGVNLFYRNNNKLTLTPEGEKFYQNAEELLAHADAVRSELHELRKQITPVRIGIPPMLGTIYLPDMYLSAYMNMDRSKPVNLFWRRNLTSRLSMQNSLRLINATFILLIMKICSSAYQRSIHLQNNPRFF